MVELVRRLRVSPDYVPELALVAEDGAEVVGAIAFSRAPLAGRRVLLLSPLGVLPDRQRSGVGSALVREAISRAEAADEPLIVLEGVPEYYPRFGFEPAAALGIEKPYASIPDVAFMALRLPAYDPSLRGELAYPEPFDPLYAHA